MKFRKFDGTPIEDIAAYLHGYFAKSEGGDYEIYVGCDSLPPKKKVTTFVTVVCIRNVGHGAHILYRKDRVANTKLKTKKGVETGDIIDRLWHEVELSVGVATYLRDKGVLEYKNKYNKVKFLHLDIHLDINPDEMHKSNLVYNSAVGFVKGMGFEFVTKPDAWAATYAADMVCRGRFDKVLVNLELTDADKN